MQSKEEQNKEFFSDLAVVLDKTIGNLSDISAKLKIFTEKSTLHGFVPPSIDDLNRFAKVNPKFAKMLKENEKIENVEEIKETDNVEKSKIEEIKDAKNIEEIKGKQEQNVEINQNQNTNEEIYQLIMKYGNKFGYPLNNFSIQKIIESSHDTVSRSKVIECMQQIMIEGQI